MSLMQMPAPNSSAKVIVSIRYASLLFQLCMQPHGYSLLLGGLFKLENTTTLTFYKLKICPSSECFKAGHWYSRVQSHIFLQHYYNYPNLNYISLFLSSNKCTCDLYFSYDKSSATVRLVPVMTSVKTSPNFTEFLRSVRITAAFV